MAKKRDHDITERDVTKITHREHDVADIADVSEEWMKIFASNVNIARITPHIIDGIKPGARRILYGMHRNPTKGTKYTKVIKIMADAVTYHPHGDSSISDVVCRMGQPWRNNVMLIDPQGNYGNIKGQEPASPRYLEAKLSEFSQDILFADLEDSNVPMRMNYLGTELEPDYLPAKVPLILCNPAFSGIGIGVATNIPPFNMSEVIQATIKLIKNPKAKVMLIPDSPTGCNIVDTGFFQTINDVGGGDDVTLTMSATYEIDYIMNIITVTSLPLKHTTDAVIARLVAMKKSGKLEKLLDIIDESREDIVSLKLILSSDANPDEFVEHLMKKRVGLRDTFPVKIRVIENFRSKVLGVPTLLLKWIDYRQECVRATYNKKLMDAINTHHMNQVYLMVLNENNINKTSEIAKSSKNKEEMMHRFMKTYGITTLQAKVLSGMGFTQFTKESYEKFKKIDEETQKNIKAYEEIIISDEAINNFIINELKEIDKKYGFPRRSAIIKAGKLEEKVPNTDHLIGVSKDGYIKKLKLPENRSIGVVGKTSQVLVAAINNRDNLLIFGDDGKISRVGVSSIPDMDVEEPGIELNRYFTLTGSPVSILNEKILNEKTCDIVIITKSGLGKRVRMSEFAKIRDAKDCITLVGDDKLVAAVPSYDDDFIVYTNFGDGVRLKTESLKYQTKAARGLSLITLRTNEEVIGIAFAENNIKNTDKILYITSSGRMKLTEERMLPVTERRGTGIALIGLDANEYLVGLAFVSTDDSVIIYQRKSKPTEVSVSDLKVTTRIAKPQKIIKTPSGDPVIGFSVRRSK